MDMKLIKRNKFTFFIIIFFFILFALVFQLKALFFPDSKDANYGDRLDGLVEVEKSTLTDMANKIKENESVKEVTSTTNGRIISVIITVNDEVGLSSAKKIGESVKDNLTEENLANYDIQVFVKKESEAENDFPIIGYKAKNNDTFSWTKDREKKTIETEEEE